MQFSVISRACAADYFYHRLQLGHLLLDDSMPLPILKKVQGNRPDGRHRNLKMIQVFKRNPLYRLKDAGLVASQLLSNPPVPGKIRIG